MNAQEKTALQDFLQEMNRVRLERKDLEADAMIRQAAQQQPDALYLLTQRALLQEQALQNAQAQIADLQKQIAQQQAGGAGGGSFLDSSSQWGRSGHALGASPAGWQAGNAAPLPTQGQYQAPPAQPQAAPSARPGLFGGAGGGSFLGSMAGVLAGAAAGHFLYQGMGQLLHRDGQQAQAQNLGDVNPGQGAQSGGMSSDNSLARDAGVNDVAASSKADASQWDDSANLQDDWSDSADGGDFLDSDDMA